MGGHGDAPLHSLLAVRCVGTTNKRIAAVLSVRKGVNIANDSRVAICQQSSRTRPRGKRSAERLRFVLQLQMDHGAQQLQAAPVGGGGAHPS